MRGIDTFRAEGEPRHRCARTRTRRALATGVAALGIVAAGVLAPASPAAAQTPTVRCSDLADSAGSVVWQRIDADLLVDGGRCTLSNVGVYGDVTVAAGGTFFMHSTSIHGDLRSAGLSTGISLSTIDGDVLLSPSTFGFFAGYSSTITGSVSGTPRWVELLRSTVVGGVDLTAETVAMRESTVHGDLTVRPAKTLELSKSTVAGDVAVDGPSTIWQRLCQSSVGGDLRVSGSSGTISLGIETMRTRCQSTVEGSVHLTGNSGDVIVRNVLVEQDLTCTGNTGRVVVGPGQSIHGVRSGQCA